MSAQDAFWELLRSALGQHQPDESFFSPETDWSEVIALAKRQAVLGLVAEAISRMPEKLRPADPLISELHRFLVLNAKAHLRINVVLAHIQTLLRTAGIPALLLKGQGLAVNYPQPKLRQSGDIDLYIPCQYQARIPALVRQWKAATHLFSSKKHLAFDYGGVAVELHNATEQFYTPSVDRRYQAWTKEQLERGAHRILDVDGVAVPTPAVEFDAIYVLHHLWNHFIATGIGLRQICDWALFMRRYSSLIDKDALRKSLDDFAFWPVWNLFSTFAVRYLGMDWRDFPLAEEADQQKVSRVMELVMSEGNFGRLIPHYKNYLLAKLNKHWRETNVMLSLFSIHRKEIFCYYLHFLRVGFKHLFVDWRQKR